MRGEGSMGSREQRSSARKKMEVSIPSFICILKSEKVGFIYRIYGWCDCMAILRGA